MEKQNIHSGSAENGYWRRSAGISPAD